MAIAQRPYQDEVDPRKPRIAIKTIDPKRHLIQLRATSEEDGGGGWAFRGHFLDLRTLAFALTNASYSLKTACEAWETEHGKIDHQPTGKVTPGGIGLRAWGRHRHLRTG